MPILLEVSHWTFRCVDGNVSEVRSTEALDLRVEIREISALKERVIGEIGTTHDVLRAERSLLGFCEEIVDAPVEDQTADALYRDESFGDQLPNITATTVLLVQTVGMAQTVPCCRNLALGVRHARATFAIVALTVCVAACGSSSKPASVAPTPSTATVPARASTSEESTPILTTVAPAEAIVNALQAKLAELSVGLPTILADAREQRAHVDIVEPRLLRAPDAGCGGSVASWVWWSATMWC
jgi:hypothetical protein